MTIFISHAVAEERIGFGPSNADVSAERGRWKRLAALYRASFVECGVTAEDVVRPEIYQTDLARTFLGIADGDWHLAVKPMRHLRPFHGIPNLFVFDGEWGEFEERQDVPSPFSDPKAVLGQSDAVLCTTEMAAASLRAQGIGNAIFLPPHVPMPAVPRARTSHGDLGGGPVSFGVFLHPGSPLDTLSEAVEGMVEARTRNAGLRLVVVVPADAGPTAVADWAARRFGDGATCAVSSVSSRSRLASSDDHLASFDYTLSIDPQDRLSIELAEAMRHGIPMVSSGHGATGLLEAAAADLPRRRELGEIARRTAERWFGLAAFKARVADLQQRLQGLSA